MKYICAIKTAGDKACRKAALCVAALCAVAVLAPGCVRQPPAPDPALAAETRRMEHDQELYRLGVAEYEAGRYEQAQLVFQQLINTATGDLRRRAMYAMALARFGGAKSEADFQRAQEAWEEWRQTRAADLCIEDPAMAAPLLPRYKAPPPRPAPPKPVKGKGEVKAAADARAEGKAEAEAERREDVNRLEDENRVLRDKIQALERLRQEIETKQKGIIAQ